MTYLFLWSFPVLFVIVGIIFAMGKGAFLIAGYNTASKEEKEKYNLKALYKYMAILCFVTAIGFSIVNIGVIYSITWLIYVMIFLMIGTTIGMVVFMNTGNRVMK